MELGIQVSSLKPLLGTAEQVELACQKMAALGCRTVQLQWIDPAVPIESVAESCRRAGLNSVSVQDFYVLAAENFEYYVNLNALTGGTWLCVSRIPRDRSLETFARELEAMREKLEPLGQRLCLHPVSGDFAPMADCPAPVEALMERLPWLELCADLYHLSLSREDVPGWLRRYPGRVCMVHFKDAVDGVLVPAGQGQVNYDGVIPACLDIGVQYGFVEQEKWDRDPYDCLGEALEWVKKNMEER